MSFDIAKYPTLALANTVQELRALPKEKLPALCDALRQYLLDSVSRSSGHFASGLGVVELTVALHYVYNTPFDDLVWDLGHQAYPHKFLTGCSSTTPRCRSPNTSARRLTAWRRSWRVKPMRDCAKAASVC